MRSIGAGKQNKEEQMTRVKFFFFQENLSLLHFSRVHLSHLGMLRKYTLVKMI